MMKMLMMKCSAEWADVGPLVLRLALGAIFIFHGYQKVFVMGHAGVTGFMTSLGLPLPELMAYLVSYGELVTGVFLIVGFLTYWVSIVDIIIAAVAFFTVHMTKGFGVSGGGYEFIMLIGASAVSLLISGAGKYSVDAQIK
jgi:putative oxidoreductase